MKMQVRRERGRRARLARESAGLSQTDMGELMGCSRQLVGSIEAGGNMNVDQLEAYCVHGKCTSDSIVFGTPQELPDDDAIARQFAKLEPWLRDRLWPLYQVFIRPAAREKAPSDPA